MSTNKQRDIMRGLLIELGYLNPESETFSHTASSLPYGPGLRGRAFGFEQWASRLTILQANEIIDFLLLEKRDNDFVGYLQRLKSSKSYKVWIYRPMRGWEYWGKHKAVSPYGAALLAKAEMQRRTPGLIKRSFRFLARLIQGRLRSGTNVRSSKPPFNAMRFKIGTVQYAVLGEESSTECPIMSCLITALNSMFMEPDRNKKPTLITVEKVVGCGYLLMLLSVLAGAVLFFF